MKINIQDIADMVGVSKSTVSRYLNGGYVSKENQEKIGEAIKKTGYQTNFFAKRLKSKNSHLIGVVVPRLDSFTTTRILKGIGEKLQSLDYEMFISISNLNVENELEFINKFYLQGIDGIIVLTTEITKKHYKLAEELPIPIIFIGQKDDKLNCIAIDDKKAGHIMGEYIKNKNHKEIVYLGVNEKDKAVGIDRKQGFMECFKDGECNINFVETDFSFEKAYEKAPEVMKFNPTSIVCATDNIAIGVLRYLHENNIKVPETISISGFGGYDIGAAIYPPLTTIAVDYKELGIKGAKAIISLIDQEELRVDEDISIELIERKSVAFKEV